MVDNKSDKDDVITIDGKEFKKKYLTGEAEAQLNNLRFVNEQIMQKHNELQIADSARLIYNKALKSEVTGTNKKNL